jgi:hypothetical protein
MGYSIRVDEFRYTLWVGFNRTTGIANLSDVHAEELYDHTVRADIGYPLFTHIPIGRYCFGLS